MEPLTIVMYHYVRQIKKSDYPGIKGLEVDDFKGQLQFMEKYYNFISPDDLIQTINGGSYLPQKPLLLTFDDGYEDHYSNVLPILLEHNIKGAFFPPFKCIMESKVLDVNKIHYLLAVQSDLDRLVQAIRDYLLSDLELGIDEEDYKALYKRLAIPNRFDDAKVIFIKRLLQRELPESIREKLVDFLFKEYVSSDEKEFANRLYMSKQQLKQMSDAGMHIGSHGYSHYWLGHLDAEKQREDITKSLDSMRSLDIPIKNWSMCYPYGSYDSKTLEILCEYGCSVAFTTEVNLAKLDSASKYTLPRLDTNDLPKDRNETSNTWHERIS